MTKVTKPIAGVKHIKANPYYTRTKQNSENSHSRAYQLKIR